ncbi:MAG: Thermostable hemolysin [Candidatus Eremiobacteraeota bacterium]|jgi:hypothetical protein|nr:Thermostable hemolysin [Candidatus Eremiobacteraeota bacterium]
MTANLTIDPGLTELVAGIARTQDDWDEGLRFCGEVYERTYGTRWLHPPDELFVARDALGVVATAGLEIARGRPSLDIERLYDLTPRMRTFVDVNRDRVAELGRFASVGRTTSEGTQAVLQAALRHCRDDGIDYVFACARAPIARRVFDLLGVTWCRVDVALNDAEACSCAGWTSSPAEVFLGGGGTRLYLVVVPFLELVLGSPPR